MTIDPPGSRDLDQALHIERRGDGHRVRYAIADVGAFVAPGGALDARDPRARRDGLRARRQDAAASARALGGRREPAARAVAPGRAVDARPRRRAASSSPPTSRAREVRSVAQHTYADVPGRRSRRCCARSASGGWRSSARAAACGSTSPSRRSSRGRRRWTVRYRVPLATEDHNAQISLLTGMAAAALMLRAGDRASCAPSRRPTSARWRGCAARRTRSASPWPRAMPYPEFVRSLDPAAAGARRAHARGDRRRPRRRLHRRSTARRPPSTEHFAIAADYAHATAPLRRLQDRYVSRVLPGRVRRDAGRPTGSAPALAGAARRDGGRRTGARTPSSAASSTSSRRCCSPGREGERFDAVVIDEALVQLREPGGARPARRRRARRRAARSPSASTAPTRPRGRSRSRCRGRLADDAQAGGDAIAPATAPWPTPSSSVRASPVGASRPPADRAHSRPGAAR